MNKFLFDFFPALLFFASNKFYSTIFGVEGAEVERVLFATKVFIVATLVQVGVYYWKHREFKAIHMITLALVLVFGGLTLYVEDKSFLQWKVTLINWLFGAILLGSQYIGKKTVIEHMLGANLTLPKHIWIRLNLSWVAFFTSVGFINIYVFSHYDWDTWMDFKLFGLMGLMIVFSFASIFAISKYLPEEEEKDNSST